MVILALLLFIFVFIASLVIYNFCKRVIYKLNRRVLPRNLAIIKNSETLENYKKLNEDEINEKLILPFFRILGYNTFDMREFKIFKKRADFLPDCIIKKWDNSKLVKRFMYIKFVDFSEKNIDLKNNKFEFSKEDFVPELMNKFYFWGEYYVLTNGYIYLFYDKKSGPSRFKFYFNVKNYKKEDISKLAYFTKQVMFLEISDVYRR